jgi:outer membrane protein
LVAQTQRQIEEQVKNAWDALRASSASIKSDEQQVRANQIALDGVEQEAQVGSRTTLDVLDATQELLNSQVALVRSQRNEVVAAYSLVATVGGLTAQSLALPVTLYDPEVNYDDVSGRWIGFGSSD